MVETAAHLADHVFPQLPVRQWVLSFPKRLRYLLHRDPALVGRVLGVVLRALEDRLRACCPRAPVTARFGAVTFIQRFGSAMNAHLHFHICVIDGVFSQDARGELRFHPATGLSPADVTAVEGLVRRRVLRLFERAGSLDPEAAEDMRRWRHGGGFSLDASVAVEAHDRAGLERLLRYCARPAFSLERLSCGAEMRPAAGRPRPWPTARRTRPNLRLRPERPRAGTPGRVPPDRVLVALEAGLWALCVGGASRVLATGRGHYRTRGFPSPRRALAMCARQPSRSSRGWRGRRI
jgi:hypothetical protein